MDSTPTARGVFDPRKKVLSLASGSAAAALATTNDANNPVAALQHLCRSVPVVDLVNLLASTAAQCNASDVHIEPRHDHVAVRYRLDGLLTAITHLPKWMDAALTSRVKVLAGMDIADKRRPQDGRLAIKGESGDIVFRVSTLPTQYGEKVVMRRFMNTPSYHRSTRSVCRMSIWNRLQGLLRNHHGMILVVGPTGSGKTTTLASALSSLHSDEMNIITLEDPIEYPLPAVNQTQINDKADLTFATALRAALRQDPDVIMLGEIRDRETAQTAMWASQTGHLVLSTLHTNDAPSAVTRLMDLGVEPYTISSTLLGVVAQRLVRKLCLHCRKPAQPSARLLADFGLDETDMATARIFGPGRLLALPPHRIPRSCGHLRDPGDDALPEIAHRSGHPRRRRSARSGVGRGDGRDAGGWAREGRARDHLDGGAAQSRQPPLCVAAIDSRGWSRRREAPGLAAERIS